MFKRMLPTLGYIWALPITLAGLLLAFLSNSKFTRKEGVVHIFEASEWLDQLFFEPFHILAFTWGATIIVAKDHELFAPALKHELVHFHQACIFGILILPLYAIGSLVALAQGKDPYWDNFLEVWARSKS